MLEKDGRISNIDLAAKVGLSASACLRRVQDLERKGIIKGYRAVIDRSVTDVCTWLFHDRIRMATDVQGVAQHTDLARKSPKLAAAFRVMANHIGVNLLVIPLAGSPSISISFNSCLP